MKWKFWGKDKDKDDPLGHIEPRTLASAMVAVVFDRENAINRWRDQDDAIPESHEDFVQISVHVYQLCIFLDLLERRFGSDVADKVKSHIISTMTTGKVAIGRFFQAAWAGRAKPEREQFFAHDTACQVDCNISRAFLDVISGAQTEKDAIYPVLAKFLSKARVLAEIGFGGPVKGVEFRPETICWPSEARRHPNKLVREVRLLRAPTPAPTHECSFSRREKEHIKGRAS